MYVRSECGMPCPNGCGGSMKKSDVYYPGMVCMSGDGFYPSEQRFVRGTAPYSTRDVKPWGSYDPDKYDMRGNLIEASS